MFNRARGSVAEDVFHGLWVTHGSLAARHALQQKQTLLWRAECLSYHCVWSTNLARSNDKLPLAIAIVPHNLASNPIRQTVMSLKYTWMVESAKVVTQSCSHRLI